MNFTCANSVSNKVMLIARFDLTMKQVHPEVYYHNVQPVYEQLNERVHNETITIRFKITQKYNK
jgi:hypothetical protein